MGVAISTLTTVTRATLISGAVISSSEHNTWSTAVKTQLNDIGTTTGVLADLEDNYASASAPGDKPAGKLWFDSANLLLKWYEVAAGTLRTVVGRDTTDTLTNKTLTSPILNSPIITSLLGSGGTATYAFPDVAARTINVSGVDQNSYVSATGTAGTDATAQIVKQITLKANSINALSRGIRIKVLYKASNTTSIVITVYIGTAGTSSDLSILTAVSTTNTVAGVLVTDILYASASTVHVFGGVGINPGAGTTVLTGASVGSSTNIANGSDMFVSVGQANAAATHITVYAIIIEQLG